MSSLIDKQKVDQALELVCEFGCVTVHEVIQEIEQGVLPEPARDLNTQERKCLLKELKAIMRTYQ